MRVDLVSIDCPMRLGLTIWDGLGLDGSYGLIALWTVWFCYQCHLLAVPGTVRQYPFAWVRFYRVSKWTFPLLSGYTFITGSL